VNISAQLHSLGGVLADIPCSKYGQPLAAMARSSSAADSDSEDDWDRTNPVVHSYLINASGGAKAGGIRLDLGVGGNGVVGRTVSILDNQSRRILGEGIIGWS
jgi:hypothetical protein